MRGQSILFSLFLLLVLAGCAKEEPIESSGVETDKAADNMTGDTVPVNIDNFVRAETALQFDRTLEMTGGIIGLDLVQTNLFHITSQLITDYRNRE